ncbi:MAG: hypothetical protein ACTSUI_08235, partial [Promethearchaeota archaeon]
MSEREQDSNESEFDNLPSEIKETPENNSDDEDSESIEMEKEKGLSFGDKIKLFIFSSIFR